MCQTYQADANHLVDDIRQLIVHHFPQLKNVGIDYAWGGQIAFGLEWFPLIGLRKPHLYYSTGFGGHGIVPTTMAGELIAQAIHSKDDSQLQLYQKDFPLRYCGWPFDKIGVQIVYSSLQIIDKIYEVWDRCCSK